MFFRYHCFLFLVYANKCIFFDITCVTYLKYTSRPKVDKLQGPMYRNSKARGTETSKLKGT